MFKGSLAVRVPRPCCPLRCHSVQTAGKNHNCSHLFQDISHRYLFTTITTGTDGLDICHHLPFPRCLSVVALQVPHILCTILKMKRKTPRPFIGSAKSEEEHLSSPVSNYTLHEESAFNTTRGATRAFLSTRTIFFSRANRAIFFISCN